ncbi:hypothetical protein GDO78_019438 [Eleutherodactylus coqui]|uniref:Uncharacterized protein n=1 Tax=Eleutherodactylus coqui TaxID=57060 RepID=A0A8J6E901_ELECQ|nr:hypothetical protein GDO78_019438 [Eleutherodactylus coqui]
MAAAKGNVQRVKELLERGTNPNVTKCHQLSRKNSNPESRIQYGCSLQRNPSLCPALALGNDVGSTTFLQWHCQKSLGVYIYGHVGYPQYWNEPQPGILA